MKHLNKIAASVLLIASVALGGCGTAQTDKFIEKLSNFSRGLAAVDATVKQVNSTIYSNCNDLVETAQAINDLSGQCSKASPYTSVANTVIDNYCQAPGVQQAGISKSIAVTAKGVSAAKSTLSANKAACAAGG